MSGCRTAIPATCSTVTVFALSVSRYVGAPPIRRSVASRHAIRLPIVLIPRRDHHPEPRPGQPAQNNCVAPPADPRAPPQSNCSHIPGSGIHGRYVRRCPARHAAFASATARRVVRSVPLTPSRAAARAPHPRGSCPATVDQLLHLRQERVDQPAAAARRAAGSAPASRIATYRATVFGQSRPAAPPNARTGQVVRLKNFHDLPARLSHGPSGTVGEMQSPRTHPSRRDHTHQDTPVTGRSHDRAPGILMAAHRELTGRTPGFSRGR